MTTLIRQDIFERMATWGGQGGGRAAIRDVLARRRT